MANATKNKRRLLSLDVLRGITVAGMILVNDGYGETYSTLQHSKWNGMTPCDLVFPFFLFIVGISTYLSLRKYSFQPSRAVIFKIIRRTVLIFFVGLFVNWFSLACKGLPLDFAHLRYWGVMQRIALCYCAVSVFAITANHRYTLHCAFSLLAVYSVILLLGNGYAYDETNIAARIDKWLFGYSHLYHKSLVDPEGLLGTLPAIAHMLIGFYASKIMMETDSLQEKVMRFLLLGGMLIIGGYLLQFGMPLNKRIWSPSYVLMTCGLCSTLQGIIMHILDNRAVTGYNPSLIDRFFLAFGVNPLFLYVLSEVLAIVFNATGINDVIYNALHCAITSPCNASLAYAITFTLLCGAVGYPLYKRRVFIKI